MTDRAWTLDSIIQLFSVIDGFSGPNCDAIWWRTDGEYAPLTIFVNCNDLFAWGCADCEEIRPGDLDELRLACEDCKNEKGAMRKGHLLWCARRRLCRPQVAYYKYLSDKEKALFDACGPTETQYGRAKDD